MRQDVLDAYAKRRRDGEEQIAAAAKAIADRSLSRCRKHVEAVTSQLQTATDESGLANVLSVSELRLALAGMDVRPKLFNGATRVKAHPELAKHLTELLAEFPQLPKVTVEAIADFPWGYALGFDNNGVGVFLISPGWLPMSHLNSFDPVEMLLADGSTCTGWLFTGVPNVPRSFWRYGKRGSEMIEPVAWRVPKDEGDEDAGN